MMWKKICCAVDLSEPSWLAAELAAELARDSRSELTLLHVRTPPPPAASDVLVSSQTVLADEERESVERLEEWRDDAERHARVPVRSAIRIGDPAGEIVRFADEEGCDLLVVGTHGRGGIPRLILGSVAEQVARHAHVPVLVARNHARLERDRDAGEAAQYM